MEFSIADIKRAVRRDGVITLFGKGYEATIRPILPAKSDGLIKMNGVKLRYNDSRILDSFIGMPCYENEEVQAIHNYLKQGDSVVEVGAGRGVTTVHTAQEIGSNGKIIAYEASSDSIEYLKSALELNETPTEIKIEHSIVGGIKNNMIPNTEDATKIDIKDLPDCDVLILDCEGAELEILSNMDIEPRVIIVETHGTFGSPTPRVRDAMADKGFEIVEHKKGMGGIDNLVAHK